MERAPDQVLRYLAELEERAESLLADRRQIIDLDARRQKTREAIRALQKDKTTDKTWLCVNNMFIKVSKDKARKLLNADMEHLDDEITRLRDGLRTSVDKLRDLESKEATKGFQLSPLTRQELSSLHDVL